MKYRYEEHILNNKLLPFLFHRDRVTNMSNLFPNFHTNIELLFCFEGRGTAVCGMNNYDFEVGDIIVINSNVLHNVYSEDYVRYYCLIVDKDFCSSNGIDINENSFVTHIRCEKARQLYTEVCNAYASTHENKIVSIRHAVLGLLLHLIMNYSTKTSEKDLKNDLIFAERIKKVVEYIQGNLDRTISLDEISDHIGISKFHLSRDFKKFTGNTIFEYINISRCKTAAALIAGGMSVSAAANECGFENLSYFSRTYKKYIGKLPSEQK